MNEKILLVDDEESNLRLLTQWLVPLGYDVDLASNGKEAVQKARDGRPDLIILDIMMPVMDGHAACLILKEDPKTMNIPIIMVTAYGWGEIQEQARDIGVDGFLSKPVNPSTMLDTLMDIIVGADRRDVEIIKVTRGTELLQAIGARILEGSDSPLLKTAADIALCHHEQWDGTGYPQGLKGDKTPLAARITMLADIYDALRNTRPYKPPIDHQKTCGIITEGDGRTMPEHFDPAVLSAFKEIAPVFAEIFNQHQ